MKFLPLNVYFSSSILDPLDSRRPAHMCVKKAYPPKSGYFTAIAWSSVRTVADIRHRYATYYNKHWQWASYKCQCRWPWM